MKKTIILLFVTSIIHVSMLAQQVDIDNSTGEEPVAIRTFGQLYENAIEQDNGIQSWRSTVWTDNDYLIVKTSGSTFTPFRIQDDSFQDALRLGSIGVGVGESNPSARLHVTTASPDVLNLESNSQTTLNFYTGSTLQYRLRKLGSTTGDFQFINTSNSYTNWVQNSGLVMALSPTGYLGIGMATDAIADTRLHVTGDGDAELYEFEVEDDDFAFMQFDAALQSGIAFRNGSATNANAWYRGNGNAGLILNTASAGGTIHFFIEDNTGHVGIGDETPDAIFDVDGDTDGCNFGNRSGAAHGYVNTQRPSGSTNSVVQRWRDNTTTMATMNDIVGTYRFTVNGSALASGGTWTNSDAKLKKNIKALEEGTIDKVMRLKPSTYEFKNTPEYKFLGLSDEEQIGFLAQELEQEFPQVVNTTIQTNADGEVAIDHELKSVNYEALVPVLTKAIQEQQEMINQLEARISELERN